MRASLRDRPYVHQRFAEIDYVADLLKLVRVYLEELQEATDAEVFLCTHLQELFLELCRAHLPPHAVDTVLVSEGAFPERGVIRVDDTLTAIHPLKTLRDKSIYLALQLEDYADYLLAEEDPGAGPLIEFADLVRNFVDGGFCRTVLPA